MNTTTTDLPRNGERFEVWLRPEHGDMSFSATLVRPDESTQALAVHAFSMTGARREVSGYLINLGCTPLTRWGKPRTGTDRSAVNGEAVRVFQAPAAS